MQRLYPYLTYAGALPFVICAACFSYGITTVPWLGETKQILAIYSLVIISFMAGSHWGQHLYLGDKWKFSLPLLSNTVAIKVWIAFLILPFAALLVSFIIVFLALLAIDKKLFEHQLITAQYFRTRCWVTAIVILMLVISGITA
ncbi:MAG: DUF3429 domain-containing protein [Chromatiales bacterium]|nr:DUF3429 domain-containing protein [Chromatiales bacterium]